MDGRLKKLIYLLMGAFMIGASLAGLITILFAPFSGKETRRRIAGRIRGLQAVSMRKQPKESWLKRLVA